MILTIHHRTPRQRWAAKNASRERSYTEALKERERRAQADASADAEAMDEARVAQFKTLIADRLGFASIAIEGDD